MNTTIAENRIKPGYKKTPVGIIPEDWEVKRFEDLVKRNSERFDPTTGICKKDLELDSFEQGTGRIVNIYDSRDYKSSKNVFEKEDVLFGKLRPYLRKYWKATFDGVCSSEIWVFKNKKPISSDYLYLVLQTKYFLNKSKITSGTKMPRAEWSSVKNAKIPIPPLPEQKSIASCLSTWDKGIDKLTQLIQAKKHQKKGLMQQIFNGQLAIDNEQLPVEIRLKKVDNEEDRLKGWKEVRLEEIGKVEYGTRIVKDRTERGNYFVYGGGGKTFTTKTFNREDNMIIARFAMSSECARFVKGKFFLNDSGLTVKSKKDTYQLFLDYILFHFQYRIYALRAGGYPPHQPRIAL